MQSFVSYATKGRIALAGVFCNILTAVQNTIVWTGEAAVLLVNLGNISHFSKSVGHPEVRMLSKSSTS
jgi:hypothetical protein